MKLSADFFSRPPEIVAPDLIGAQFTLNGVGGIIVETEAYSSDDPASHSFRGRTRKNASMFGLHAHSYVYRAYGLHWCLNIVSGNSAGNAVLLRALEPVANLDLMRQRRKLTEIRLLCSGPGRLCDALGITREHDGMCVTSSPFSLVKPRGDFRLCTGRRVGISRAADVPWRFALAGSPFVSKKMVD